MVYAGSESLTGQTNKTAVFRDVNISCHIPEGSALQCMIYFLCSFISTATVV
jgi:hypothetical protein